MKNIRYLTEYACDSCQRTVSQFGYHTHKLPPGMFEFDLFGDFLPKRNTRLTEIPLSHFCRKCLKKEEIIDLLGPILTEYKEAYKLKW